MAPLELVAQGLFPFAHFGFMRRALAACCIMGIGFAPIGVLILHRRMSLVGDSMSHGILPGAAIGYRLFGASLPGMALGGIAAGLAIAWLSARISGNGREKADASFAVMSLLSLAFGVILVSRGTSQVDLMHMLFGSVLAIDDATLWGLAGMAALAIVVHGCGYRLLAGDACDPHFMAGQFHAAKWAYPVFIGWVALGLCAGFQALGTLMSIGLILIPAAAAQNLSQRLAVQNILATCLAVSSSFLGLGISYHVAWPTGPCIIICCGACYAASYAWALHKGRG